MDPRQAHQPKIIFFPALGCDWRLGRRHHELPFPIEWAHWVPVRPEDDFNSYAKKIEATLKPPENCYFAGTSLGGAVALHLASKLKPRGVILIGSMRSSAGVDPVIRWLVRSLIRFLPEALLNLNWVPGRIVSSHFHLPDRPQVALLREMVRRHHGRDLRRLCELAVSVPELIDPGCPVLSIHGTEDKILSYFEDEIDVPLYGAGHFISLTHAEEVNSAIANFVEMVEGGVWREGLYHTLLRARLAKAI